MPDILYRPARLDDSEALAKLMRMAGGGIADFLLQDRFEDLSCHELIKMVVADEVTPMGYHNHIVAEHQGRVVSAINYYPAEQHILPDIVHNLIPAERIEYLADFYQVPIEQSLYLHSIATLPDYQRQGISTALYTHLQDIAKAGNFTSISAHVWQGNHAAVNAFKKLGFSQHSIVEIKPDPAFTYQSNIVLLKAPITGPS